MMYKSRHCAPKTKWQPYGAELLHLLKRMHSILSQSRCNYRDVEKQTLYAKDEMATLRCRVAASSEMNAFNFVPKPLQIKEKTESAEVGPDKINRMESGGVESAAMCQQTQNRGGRVRKCELGNNPCASEDRNAINLNEK